MYRAVLVLAVPTLLAACEPGSVAVSLSGDRQATEEIATQVLGPRDPVVPIEPVATCVARGASTEEAGIIAEAGRTGDSALASETIDMVLRRSGTQECLETAGVPDFGLT